MAASAELPAASLDGTYSRSRISKKHQFLARFHRSANTMTIGPDSMLAWEIDILEEQEGPGSTRAEVGQPLPATGT